MQGRLVLAWDPSSAIPSPWCNAPLDARRDEGDSAGYPRIAEVRLCKGSMSKRHRLQFDEIGYWSEVKLDIVRKYASAYSKILSARKSPRLEHVYVDAFAGAGVHISQKTGPSSPAVRSMPFRFSRPFMPIT